MYAVFKEFEICLDSSPLIIDEISSTKGLAAAYTSFFIFFLFLVYCLSLDRRKNYMGFHICRWILFYFCNITFVFFLIFLFHNHFSGFDFAWHLLQQNRVWVQYFIDQLSLNLYFQYFMFMPMSVCLVLSFVPIKFHIHDFLKRYHPLMGPSYNISLANLDPIGCLAFRAQTAKNGANFGK